MPVSGYFDKAFAVNGDLNTIPDALQPGGSVSYDQGFPIKYSTAVGSGGLNVPRTAINQALFDATSAIKILQQQAIWDYIADSDGLGNPFSYSKGFLCFSGGVIYQSLTNANVTAPPSAQWQALQFRTQLQADTTFYVATTGNDSNPGTNASPWLTLQHAYDYLTHSVDQAGFIATIQSLDGSYAVGVIGNSPSTGPIVFNGNNATPSNVLITPTSADGIFISGSGYPVFVQHLQINTTTSGSGLKAWGGAQIIISAPVEFGAVADYALYPALSGQILIQGSVKIKANAKGFVVSDSNGVMSCSTETITLTGTPAFSVAFSVFQRNSTQAWAGITFSGAATGVRYLGSLNAVADTNGGGGTYLPGNSAGSVATGAQYA